MSTRQRKCNCLGWGCIKDLVEYEARAKAAHRAAQAPRPLPPLREEWDWLHIGVFLVVLGLVFGFWAWVIFEVLPR